MKAISYEILDLINIIQNLAVKIPNIHVYYQSDIYLFEVYIIKNNNHIYKKTVYIDGVLSNYNQVIRDLKDIIRDLEEILNESNSKNKFVRK